MSEIPSEFFSKKSFESLPRLAFLTWLCVLIIDAVILQRLPYSYMRVLYIWIIGMAVSFLFELVRYKNLEDLNKSEYKKYFMLLNAFLIFLYASSFTGITKQIGAWGEVQEVINTGNDSGIEATDTPKKASIFLIAEEWAIPILAKQTSYFPDVTTIAENSELKKEIKGLRDSLATGGSEGNSAIITDENRVIGTLKEDMSVLSNSLADCEQKISNGNVNPTKDGEALMAEIEGLRNANNQLTENDSLMNSQIQTLQQRINAFNTKQSEWAKLTNEDYDINIKPMLNSVSQDSTYFDFLFYTPIDATLPGN